MYEKCKIKNTNIYIMLLAFYSLFYSKFKFRLVTSRLKLEEIME